MDAAAVSFALGQQAASTDSTHRSVVQECLELQACGVFRRQQFVKGLQSSLQQLQSVELVGLANELIQHHFFGLDLLQALLPDPAAACIIIHKACSSYQTTRQLLLQPPAAAHGGSACGKSAVPVPAVVQLLQQLLSQAIEAQQVDTNSNDDVGVDLRQYVQSVVQRLQEAAACHEVLAVALFQAARACAVFNGAACVAGWMQQLLHKLLKPPVAPSPTQQQAAAVANQAWEALAFKHSCWSFTMPCMLSCLALPELLQGCMQDAATSPEGMAVLCAALAGLKSCGSGPRKALPEMLVSALSSALKEGQLAALLPAMLLAQRLAATNTGYRKLLQEAVDAGLPSDSPTAAGGWSCFIAAVTETYAGADQAHVQAHLQVLKQQEVRAAAGTALRQQISNTVGLLEDVLLDLKQQEQQQPGLQQQHVKLDDSYKLFLRQFEQLTPENGRRPLPQTRIGYWRMQMGSVAAFCDAISLNPPDTPHEARVRWEYLRALQDHKLCLGQFDKFIKQLFQTCDACGIDLEDVESTVPAAAGSSRAAAAAAGAGGPIAVLKQRLSKLPRIVASQQLPTVHSLLENISEQLDKLLQQQHADDAHPAKRRCLSVSAHAAGAVGAAAAAGAAGAAAATASAGAAAAGAGSSSSGVNSARPEELVSLLLTAHDAATLQQQGGTNIEWRLGFVRLLQKASALHGALLQHLLGSMTGARADCSHQQVCAHGRLVALMAASQPCQLHVMQRGSNTLVRQRDAAAALYTWHPAPLPCSPEATANTSGSSAGASSATAAVASTAAAAAAVAVAGARSAESAEAVPTALPYWGSELCGCELVQQLMSRACLASAHQMCCAVSFWAGYLAQVQQMGRWCAGMYGPLSQSTPGSSTTPPPANQPQLLGYVPQQMVALLRLLAQQLGEVGPGAVHSEAEMGVVQQCHKVCNALLNSSRQLKWVCQQYQM